MVNSDDADILTNITNLEAAKQEIARLLEFQKKAYCFLGEFCNYDVREPLFAASGSAKLLKSEELIDQHPALLQTILENHERINRVSIAVREAAAFEERWKNRTNSLKTGYPAENLNVNLILNKSIQEIRAVIGHQNNTDIKGQGCETIWANTAFAEDLPAVQYNSLMLEGVLSNLIWFITDRNLNTEIRVATDFDNQWVKITFFCFTADPHRYVFVLNEFEKFNDGSSFMDFNPISIFLYNSWNTLKIYDGLLTYNVQDNTGKEMPSTVEIIMWLKR